MTTAPTDPEVVTIRGRATIGGTRLVWEQIGLAAGPAAFIAIETQAATSRVVLFTPEGAEGWTERILYEPTREVIHEAVMAPAGAPALLLDGETVHVALVEAIGAPDATVHYIRP